MANNLFVIPINDSIRFSNALVKPLIDTTKGDILIIDDGSMEDIFAIIEENKKLKYIKHEQNLGFGAIFLSAYKYARDFNYETIMFFDCLCKKISEDINTILENLAYGYDIINMSRILENFNYDQIAQQDIDITTQITSNLSEITEFNLTDPLSGILAINMHSLSNMELTEFNHSLLLQLWIQASYFGLNVIELPTITENTSFAHEIQEYEDPLGLFLSCIESEKHLYKKGNIN